MAISELKKALTASGAPDLNPYDLEPVLYEELLHQQPLLQLLNVAQAEGLTHEYRMRSTHPQGWFEGETTGANVQIGTYTRKTVAMKIQRIWGSVTGFAQKVDEKFINALAEELNGSVQGMADLFEYGILFGCADDIGFTGDAYQYSGILSRLYKLAPSNIIDGGGAKVTLDMLDQVQSKVGIYRNVRNDPMFWLMGMRMKQIVDGLQSKVQLPLSSMTLADGKLVMDAYGKAPIYETEYMVPADSSTSPALTSALAASGSLADGTAVQHRIASVTMYGEQVASALSTARTPGTGNNKVTLTWTADSTARLYMIFRKLGTGAVQLIDIIPAVTYDADGKVNGTVATYTDDGSKTAVAVKPLETGEQTIALINRNPARGASIMGMVDDMGSRVDGLVSHVELARTKDSYDYFLKSYSTLKLVYPNLVSAIRHVKLSA
jgi:hypothetical protein